MYTVIIILHIIASIFLIAVILLQAGRGGGLADSLGGSQMQSLFGTKSASILTKLTTICAILFIVTCLSLAIISSNRSKSLMDKMGFPDTAVPVDVGPEETRADAEQKPIPAGAETNEVQ